MSVSNSDLQWIRIILIYINSNFHVCVWYVYACMHAYNIYYKVIRMFHAIWRHTLSKNYNYSIIYCLSCCSTAVSFFFGTQKRCQAEWQCLPPFIWETSFFHIMTVREDLDCLYAKHHLLCSYVGKKVKQVVIKWGRVKNDWTCWVTHLFPSFRTHPNALFGKQWVWLQ